MKLETSASGAPSLRRRCASCERGDSPIINFARSAEAFAADSKKQSCGPWIQNEMPAFFMRLTNGNVTDQLYFLTLHLACVLQRLRIKKYGKAAKSSQ
jgi:hypothetical protein